MTTTHEGTLLDRGSGAEPGPRSPAGRTRPHSRYSWLWLLMGAALLPVVNLQTVLPVAAWLAPVFLLRFTRTQRAWVAIPVLVAVTSAAMLVALRGEFFPVASGTGYALFIAGLGVGGTLPYAIDRLLAPRLTTATRTLVFPLAVTTSELLATFGNPSAPPAARPTPSTPASPCNSSSP